MDERKDEKKERRKDRWMIEIRNDEWLNGTNEREAEGWMDEWMREIDGEKGDQWMNG